ncbi:hypothetical protein D3C78_1650070 [compost metagenome]
MVIRCQVIKNQRIEKNSTGKRGFVEERSCVMFLGCFINFMGGILMVVVVILIGVVGFWNR